VIVFEHSNYGDIIWTQ